MKKTDQISEEDILEDLRDKQIVKRDEIEIEPSEQEDDASPTINLINLSETQIKDLRSEVFKHFDALKADRKEEEDEWERREAQYDGEVVEEPGVEFNLNVPVTQDKCDKVERFTMKAFMESDPKFVCQLRPEAMRQGMTQEEIEQKCRSQEEYLDYLLDERIDLETPMRHSVHQSVLLDGGFVKTPYKYQRKRKTREEAYSGKETLGMAPGGQGQIKIPEGLAAFLANYPEAAVPGQQGHEYFKRLMEFKDVKFKATYWEVGYDDADVEFVDCRDFYARKSADGYKGLCEEQIYVERIRRTYWEMKKMEEHGSLEGVEAMKFAESVEDGTDGLPESDNYDMIEHKILEVTYYFNIDGEETRILCWFGEENKAFLGATDYPYDDVECIYVPIYCTNKKPGLYKPGLAKFLKHSNQAQNAFLNMGLTEIWQELISTPIVQEGSSLAGQILSHNFRSGQTMTIKKNESLNEILGYFGKDKTRSNVTSSLMNLMLYMARLDDDRSGVNAGLSGKENPVDPNAPAAKTAMLLKQSGINVEDYIKVMARGFNQIAKNIMRLEYQMATGGKMYRVKQKSARVTGSPVFGEISRDDLILDTLIQSRAASFAFDKVAEKQEDAVLLKMMRNDPMFARYPKAIREMWIAVMESWGPKWKAKARQMALTEEEFDQYITQLSVNALGAYMKELESTAEGMLSGGAPQIEQLKAKIQQMLQQVFSPTEEQLKGEQNG